MSDTSWTLTDDERRTLGAALDALLPPDGTFPAPSQTGMIERFILRRVPAAGAEHVPYPWIDAAMLKATLAALAADAATRDMTASLEWLQIERPDEFTALWRLAVYGYYSEPNTIAAIQRDLAPGYHGAPLPLGYDHVIPPWDPADPLQLPRTPRGSYVPTDQVRRVDLSPLERRGDEA
ncbi:MAG TPA: hypothetical protein VMM78_01125 [Thermomicrobiales bacterium]|nr:hypothetical protein [Thermomicrobiales bacterium]